MGRKADRLRDLGEDLLRHLGQDRERAKLIIVCAVLAGALLLLSFSVIPMMRSRPKAKEQDSAAWTLAHELNAALAAEPRFVDTVFDVESESPIKLKLHGAVKTQRDLDDLKELIKKVKPGEPADRYDYDVEVLK